MKYRIYGALQDKTFTGSPIRASNGKDLLYWNGWACPTFDVTTALRIARLTVEQPDSGYSWFSYDGKEIVLHYEQGNEDEPYPIIDGRCAIGAFSWVWEEDE